MHVFLGQKKDERFKICYKYSQKISALLQYDLIVKMRIFPEGLKSLNILIYILTLRYSGIG